MQEHAGARRADIERQIDRHRFSVGADRIRLHEAQRRQFAGLLQHGEHGQIVRQMFERARGAGIVR